MIHLDGSLGEGGGQILRSALALSMVSGRPFRIEKIRANREKPGLLRQHLTAVQAAATISNATIDGAVIGSRALSFTPGPVCPGQYTFSVGSAGSTTLVLQAILPALLTAGGPSSLTLEGGTHNPHAPPLDFLEKSFLPILNRMGPQVFVSLERPGFYPAGGGRFFVNIQPSEKLAPIDLTERGEIRRRLCKAVVAALPGAIALRELDLVKRMMGWPEECFQIRQLPDEHGPGNIVTIELESEHITEVCTGFGMRGVKAEAVAESALQEVRRYLTSGVPVGENLADQLLLPFALAGGGSFITRPLSLHSTTNIQIIETFLPVRIHVDELGEERCKVSITGSREQ